MQPQLCIIKYWGSCAWPRYNNKKNSTITSTHCISISGCSLYSPLPNSKTLVVRRTDKSSILINKGDGVDGSQVAVVLLNHLTCPDVPLTERHKGAESETDREKVNTCIYDKSKHNKVDCLNRFTKPHPNWFHCIFFLFLWSADYLHKCSFKLCWCSGMMTPISYLTGFSF